MKENTTPPEHELILHKHFLPSHNTVNKLPKMIGKTKPSTFVYYH